MCTSLSGLLRDVHGVIQRREEGGRDRGDQEDKGAGGGGIKRSIPVADSF